MRKGSRTRSISGPSDLPQRGLWFDGRIAIEREVEVAPAPNGVRLLDAHGGEHFAETADLVRLDAPAGLRKFGHRGVEGWRLVLNEPVAPELGSALPARGGSLAPAVSRGTMAVLIAISVCISVVAGVVIFAPEALARRMPMEWERRIGAAYELPVAATRCENPRIRAALDSMLDRLDPKARADGLRLDLVNVDMANAVALPGGRMVLFDGMLDEADDPDAVAGVIAHEVAHVRRRHVAAAMVRELGLNTVVMLMGGGAVAGNAGGLLSLRYSRAAESEADADAIATLKRAGISPRPTADMFRRLSREAGEGSTSALEFMQSHPLSRGRADRFAASEVRGAAYRPALTIAEFRQLRAECGKAREPR